MLSIPINHIGQNPLDTMMEYRITVDFGSIIILNIFDFYTGTEDIDGDCNVMFKVSVFCIYFI